MEQGFELGTKSRGIKEKEIELEDIYSVARN